MVVSMACLLLISPVLEVTHGSVTQGPQLEGLLVAMQAVLCTKLRCLRGNDVTSGLENF